jgi:hypothetical protein
VLRAANAQDIVAIEVPKNLNFADYMVIVSARSMRHMRAILADIKWIVSILYPLKAACPRISQNISRKIKLEKI